MRTGALDADGGSAGTEVAASSVLALVSAFAFGRTTVGDSTLGVEGKIGKVSTFILTLTFPELLGVISDIRGGGGNAVKWGGGAIGKSRAFDAT